MSKWCKWNHTKRNNLMFVSHQQQTGEKHALPPAQLRSLRIRSSIRKRIFHLCAFVLPFQTWSIRKEASFFLDLPVFKPNYVCQSGHQNYDREGKSSEHGQYPFPSLRRRMVPVQRCRMWFACWNPAILFQAIPHTVGAEQKCVAL